MLEDKQRVRAHSVCWISKHPCPYITLPFKTAWWGSNPLRSCSRQMANHPGLLGMSEFSGHGTFSFKTRIVPGKQNKLVSLNRKPLMSWSGPTHLSYHSLLSPGSTRPHFLERAQTAMLLSTFFLCIQPVGHLLWAWLPTGDIAPPSETLPSPWLTPPHLSVFRCQLSGLFIKQVSPSF